ncbi:MAG: anti-sigma regulatory factor [Pseudomonadota bacterium]
MSIVRPRTQRVFAMAHASEISAARRHGQVLADEAGIGSIQAGKLAIAVTEAGTNILKHAVEGWLVISAATQNGCAGVEVLALDIGEGIANIGQSLRDGVSTSGTAGTGLGAMRRLSDTFDLYSAPAQGTAVYMFIGAAPSTDMLPEGMMQALPQRLQAGAVCLPVAGEDQCGDDWDLEQDQHGATIVVVDGLGHGPGAATAAHAAVASVRRSADKTPITMMQAMHTALAPTRGAAAAVARLTFNDDNLTFVGVGNITASVQDQERSQHLMSHNGIVGHNLRKAQAMPARWAVGACCILCSDGIGTQWNLNRYPGLLSCHPALIAGVLYRDFKRLRDDATVLVIKRLN